MVAQHVVFFSFVCVLARPAYAQLKVGGLLQSTSHGANAKKAVEAWMNTISDMPSHGSVQTSFKEWVKADAAALVKPMTTKGNAEYVDVLFGPYGSGDNIEMIKHVDSSFEGVILIWGGASGTIFTDCAALGRCFGFFTTATKYMTSGIEAVSAAEGSAMTAAVITNNNGFSKAVAAGAKTLMVSAGSAAGVGLVADVQLESAKGDLSTADQASIAAVLDMKPDMYVIAGHNKDVEPVIQMIGRSGHMPKAILATNSITSVALNNFGSDWEYANGVLMPTQWAEKGDLKDSIIGWDSATFKQALGESATYHSASAGAAAIAISHAMANQNDKTLLEAFKSLNFDSFYGKIAFNSDGTTQKPMFTQQKQADVNVIVAPKSGVEPGNSMKYPLSASNLWCGWMPKSVDGMLCGEMKAAYKASKCCGNPTKPFVWSGQQRRLSTHNLIDQVQKELEQARLSGGQAKVDELADMVLKKVMSFKAKGEM